MSDRLALALPIDAVRAVDVTRTRTQIQNDLVLGSDDDMDVFASAIEDAESEFESLTDAGVRLSRAGTPGDRTTFDQVTHSVPGHLAFKQAYTGSGARYLPQQVTKDLPNGRVLPFDSTEGDEAYIYRGIGGASSGSWEDATDDYGELWEIINHRSGEVAISPREVHKAMIGSIHGLGGVNDRLDEVRLAVSYRYGTLGGERGHAGATTLDAQLSQGATVPTTVGVSDASRLPTSGGGSVTLLIGREYVRATVDASNDQIEVVERGVRGTDDAGHASGDRVQYTPGGVRNAVAAKAAMKILGGGRHSGWLPDAEDDIDQSELLDRLGETWQTTVDAMS